MSLVRLVGALALAALLAFQLSPAVAGPAVTPLVSTEWLTAQLGADDLRIVDLRSGAAAAAFEAAHIPGSIRTDYPGAWRNRDWSLPETSALEAYLSSLGVGPSTTVVLVPAGTGSTELGGATWVYWVLKHLGHERVAILDGGWAAWQADPNAPKAAGPGAATPAAAAFIAAIRPDILISTDAVARELHTDTVIVDARPPDQYRGDSKSTLVARAGHIPGAISLDNARFYDSTAERLKPAAALALELPPQLRDRGARVISYCNTGHWSSINWFVLHELLGFENATLYAGSMAAWAAREDLPVELGPAAGAGN